VNFLVSEKPGMVEVGPEKLGVGRNANER
jgi:hypothetical protein